MRLFVHEFFCSGAYSGDLGVSLVREGLAMLRAVLEDFSKCGDCRIHTTLDCRLSEHVAHFPLSDWAETHWVESAADERPLFKTLAAQAEATFVIAPESDGCLHERRRLVDSSGGRFLGHSADAIQRCADKLRFFDHLRRHNLPTIPTAHFDLSANQIAFPFPIVVKPRNGAGSQGTFLIRDRPGLERTRADLERKFAATDSAALMRPYIVQPYIDGHSLSVAAMVDGDTGQADIFPVGQQRLSDDGRFQYQGGRIPAHAPPVTNARRIVNAACRSIPGLAGYIGFDLIQSQSSGSVLIVEANPRLTTAYLGYRVLCGENLAGRILETARNRPINWLAGAVEFTADGQISFEPTNAVAPA
jgi:tyramine---L-glutamate ligase